ncbi:MAG TPA: hypothetical protein PLH93_01215 [Flavobacteriales bacterium]|nr:hypothetical protein [Flavobacteriales bacterium]HQW85768.1 hypothetical protein [Flavobacteriales bacterium]
MARHLLDVRSGENFHIVLWLVKDTCWALDLGVPASAMVLPTVAVAVFIAWKHRHEPYERAHALATVFWILANSTWMVGEFYFNDRLRTPAIVLFALGMCCVVWYYLFERSRAPRTPAG